MITVKKAVQPNPIFTLLSYIHTDVELWIVSHVQRVLNIPNERSNILCFGCMKTYQLAAASLCATQTL